MQYRFTENVQYYIYKNSPCRQNVEFVNVKPGGTYTNHWGWKGCVGYYVTLVCTGGFRYRRILYLHFRISGVLFGVPPPFLRHVSQPSPISHSAVQ